MPRFKKQPLTEVVSIRLSKCDKDLLDEVSKHAPFVARLTIARYALRFGLMTMRNSRGVRRVLERVCADD